MTERTAAAVALLTSALTVAGCSGSGGSGPAAATAAPATSSAAPSTSATTAATGSGAPAPSAAADGEAPVLAVAAPDRGLITGRAQVAVEAVVSDAGSGVAEVLVDGAPVPVGPTGQVRQTVPLESGLNAITIEARDRAGNATTTVVPVLAGAFRSEQQMLEDALVVRLGRRAFEVAADEAERRADGRALAAAIMARDPLAVQNGVRVSPVSAKLGDPTIRLAPKAGALRFDVVVPGLELEARVVAPNLFNVTARVLARATRVRLAADAAPRIDRASGKVMTEVRDPTVELDGFVLDVQNVPGFLDNLARAQVRQTVESAIEQELTTTLPRVLDDLLADRLGKPIRRNVQGRPVTFSFRPTRIAVDAAGATVTAAADVAAPPAQGAPRSPGSLVDGRRGAPAVDPSADAEVALDTDLLNRAAHAAWRAGYLDVAVTPRLVNGRLPVPLDGFFLASLLPELAPHVDPADPIALEVRAGLPPVFATRARPDLLEVALGALEVDVYRAVPNQPRELLLRLGVNVEGTIDARVAAGNVLEVELGRAPDVLIDVVDAPRARVDLTGLRNLIDLLLPQVVRLQARSWSRFPLPALGGVPLQQVTLERDQVAPRYLKVSGDL